MPFANSQTEPRLHHVQCLGASGLHRMAYWEWGAADNPRVLVCVHGLSRQGRDFDKLARTMLDQYRVICPDVVGRGQSDFLADPSGYQLPAYVADMVTLLARLDARQLHWVGTSMGGLIGMGLASLANSPIERLVLNDVGPAIAPEALARIGTYVGAALQWPSVEAAADYLLTISQGFGPHSREQWLELTQAMVKPAKATDGAAVWEPHYDPGIAVPFRAITPEIAKAGEAQLWKAYDAVRCPTLLLRGAESDLLTIETAREMTCRGPRAELHELPGVGHAPTLVHDDQIAVVRDFLLGS
ncbi:alpha/beta fold hydrolase [Piscinibacter sakaiensis]|uniref:alpha/beta fold hydrolase n=1 Tax=Piscinibacter sakaiensis TaxID=1547922 RepID=UPI003AABDAF4